MFWHRKLLVFDRNLREPAYTIGNKEVAICSEDQTISSAAELLLEGYRKLPVAGKNGKLAGIITITDVLSYIGAGDKHRLFRRMNAPVKYIMERPVFIGKGVSIGKCIRIFQKHGRGSYPVVDGGRVVAVVSEWDIVKNISEKTGLGVKDIMVKKPIFARPDCTIYEAARMMVNGFRRVPVAENGKLAGIATPSDILNYLYRKNNLEGLKSAGGKIADIMERRVVAARPETSVSKVLAVMKNRGIGGFPVRENGKLVGIVTERDLVEHL